MSRPLGDKILKNFPRKTSFDSAKCVNEKSTFMPVARREVTKSGYSCCKKAGDEDLLADKKVSPE